MTSGGPHGGDHVDRVVPVYAFTRGRTRSAGRELPLEALVMATELAVRHQDDAASGIRTTRRCSSSGGPS